MFKFLRGMSDFTAILFNYPRVNVVEAVCLTAKQPFFTEELLAQLERQCAASSLAGLSC